MIVNASYGEAAPFSALEGGDCYFYELHGKAVFAMAVKAPEGNMLAFVFAEGAQQAPWVAFGGHPYSILRVLKVEIRPDLSSLHFGPYEIGELISAAGQFYILGAAGQHERRTANLSKGLAETIPQDTQIASFSRWAAGVILDGKWTPVYQFPLSKAGTP